MKNMSDLIAEIAPDLTRGEIIFYDDDQIATMQTQVITPALDRLIDILNKSKAKAGG
jgi:hypothetical protein